MSSKNKTTLSLNPELVKRAKRLGLNITAETTRHLELLLDNDFNIIEAISTCGLCKNVGTPETQKFFSIDGNDEEDGYICEFLFVCPVCFQKIINGKFDEWDDKLVEMITSALGKAKKHKDPFDTGYIGEYQSEDEDRHTTGVILNDLKENRLARVKSEAGIISYPLQDISEDYKKEWEEEKALKTKKP